MQGRKKATPTFGFPELLAPLGVKKSWFGCGVRRVSPLSEYVSKYHPSTCDKLVDLVLSDIRGVLFSVMLGLWVLLLAEVLHYVIHFQAPKPQFCPALMLSTCIE